MANTDKGLQVWLPLTKDLSNQGIAKTAVTSSATYDASGKLGGCYKNGEVWSGWGTGYNACVGLTAMCWCKFSNTTTNAQIMNSVHDYPNNTRFYVGCYNGYFSGGLGDTGWGDSAADRKIEANQWYHVCMTAEGTKWTLYINGNKVQEKTSSVNSVILYGDIHIGEKAGYYNDFRIYSYALSPQEIKELSRGIVGHWLGNDHQVLYTKCQNITWNQLFNDNWKTSHNGMTITKNTSGSVSISGTVNTSYTYNEIAISDYFTLKRDGRKYLLRINKHPGINWGITGYGCGQTGTTWIFSQTTGSDWTASFALSGNNGTKINFSDLYFQIFDLTTMFGVGKEPSANDFCTMFPSWHYPYDRGTSKSFQAFLSDISGFGRHGQVTGEVTLDASTPRYDKSLVLNRDSKVSMSGLPDGTSGFTVSFWYKIDPSNTWTQFNDVITFGTKHITNGGSGQLRLENSGTSATSQLFWYANSTFDSLDLFHNSGESNKSWNHYVLTYKDNKFETYKNGTKVSEKILSSTYQNQFSLSGSMSIGDITAKGQYSDIRLYATDLSADDVKELYALGH